MVNNTLSFEGLTLEEQKAVTVLKQRMAGCMKPEMYSDLSVFVRFLRARDLNVNAAEAMLRNHLEWRKANQVDTIRTNFTTKEVVKKYLPMNVLGLDKDGCPILYMNVGGLDSKGLLKSCRKIDIIKHIIQLLEETVVCLKEQSIKLGKSMEKWTMLLNFKNLSLAVATHKETLEIIAGLISMYEANYPERLKMAFFINSSMPFALAFAILKHFISEPTYRKIRFHGSEGWLEDVSSVIGEDALPAFLGGKRTDPDGNPLCKTIVTHGGLVDESYFVNRKTSSIANSPGVEKLTVTRMSKMHVALNVLESGTYIEWEFETKNRDIAFSLHYKENDNDPNLQELIPKQRIDTYMSSETGIMKCEKPGLYIVEFDNSYSWIFRKEVFYRLALVKN